MIVDIIIPSLKKEHAWNCIESLRHIPFGYRLHLMTEGKSWPEAINSGIKESTGDVLFMDDDIQVLPETFKDFESYYPKADIFGFKLLFPNRFIQHAGGCVNRNNLGHYGHGASAGFDEPTYVSHVTASLMYVKRSVIDKIGGIAIDYPGDQFEDVDFNLRAINAGFKILYVPGEAIHSESQTKKQDVKFLERFAANKAELINRYWNNEKLMNKLDKYPYAV